MDTQQIVVLICRDPKIRGHIFSGDVNNPIVQARLAIYQSLAPEVNMAEVLELVPLMLMRASLHQQAGALKLSDVVKTGKSVIMNGITVTMRSILERDFDKDRIDNNLRDGAANRKRYIDKYQVAYVKLREKYPRMSKNEVKLRADDMAMSAMAKEDARKDVLDTKYAVTEVKPGEKQTIVVTNDPVVVDGPTKMDYAEGVKILSQEKPVDALDVQISAPLPEEPVGKTGASLIVES